MSSSSASQSGSDLNAITYAGTINLNEGSEGVDSMVAVVNGGG